MKKITLTDFEKNHTRKIISWRYRLALLFGVFFWGISSFAQTIQLGSGSTTNSYLPLYYLYDKNYTQTIYTAAELTQAGASATGGTITKIRFKPTASVTTLDWRYWTIYMDNTSKIGFESTSDWIPIGDFTQVFSGNIPDNTVANTWMEITLTTPFVWDGSNIAIAITETTPNWGGNPSWASYTLAPSVGNKAIYKYQDGDDINLTSPPVGTRVNAVAQIQFDGTLQLGCTGIPNAGTATLSPTQGNSGSTFTASATGVTGASGLSFQWQRNVEGNWQNIAGATTLTSTITAQTGVIGNSMEYRLAVTCTASGETVYSIPATFTIALTYCTPTGGGNNADEIRNFTLNNLNNNSAASEGVAGYKDYSDTVAPAQLEIGVPYIATVTGGTGSGNHGAAIWIDYNKNGTFEASEKVAFIGNTIGANVTASFPEFVVPTGTPLGIYRLRVQHQYNKSGELLDPCILSSTLAETEDYNVQIFPTPTCLQPSGLTTLNLTDTSADLAWTSTGTLFDLEWGLQGFVQGTGTTATGITGPHSISNLQPITSYSFYVRRNCGATDGMSLWTGPYTFKTPCSSVTSFFQNFDSSQTGSTSPMPDCWNKAGNGTTYVTTGSVAPSSPANRLYMLANGTATTPTEGFAIMPAVSNLQANTHRLKFKAYATTTSKTMEVGYFTNLLDISSFETLEVIQLPGTTAATAQEFILEPYGIPAGVTNLVFRNNAPTGSTTIYIDDVTWEQIPLCDDIVTVQTQTFNSTSATVSWEIGGGENAWEYVYAVSTVTSPAGLTPVAVTNNPIVTLSNLIPNTSYKIWIRSNCGNNALGNWPNTPHTFTTSCEAVTVFSENFDSYTATGSTNPLPTCWTRFGNTGSSYITTGSVVPFSPANRLYLSASATTPTDAYAVMPPVSNLQAETHRLRFKGYATAAGKAIEIGYFELAGDASSFVVLETFEMPSTVIANATEFVYAPQFVPPGIESLAFKVNGAAFTGTTTIYIDDVYWEVLPSCPDITEFEIEDVAATTADIYWNPGGSETAWQYVYAESTVTDPNTLTPSDITNNPYLSLIDLLPSTTYKLWVRSNCGSGLLGNWSSPLSFTTPCAPIVTLPWNEGFEGITTVGTTAFPPCWFEENGDWASTNATSYNTPKSGTKYIRNSWTATNEYMWTPGFELTAGTSYDFSFYMQGDGYTGWNVDIFHNSVQNNVDAVQIGETIIAPGSGTIAIQPYTYVKNTFIPNSSGVYYFAIRVNQASGTPWYIAFDDFKMEVTPTCIAPLMDTVGNITSTTATASWSSSSVAANGYEYFLTTDAALIPNATTTPTGTIESTSSTLNLTNLTPSTVYYVYVRALCSSTDISSWSDAATFKTLCAEVAIFSENFDANATGTTSPMPPCWSKAGNGTTYVTTGGVAPGTAPNRLYMFASGVATIPTVAYAIMPPVSNLQANTHRLKFKAYATTANKYIEIGYFTNTADLESFVLLESINLPGTTAAVAQTFTFESANIPAGITSLVFRNPGTPTASTTLYIDDVIWEPKPNVVPNCATNVVATPNTSCGNFVTSITWNATPDADGYYLTIGTTAGGNDVLNNQNIGLVTSYNHFGALNTTYYFSVVPFNSAGPATNCTPQSFTTVATGCYCTSVPSSNDGSGITNVLLGTQNFPTGDVTYFNHSATTVDLNQGLLSNLKVSFATGFTYSTIVWIDFNDDYTFGPDEIVFTGESLATNPTIYDASFMMPMNANLGAHRMRIVATDAVQTPSNPCYNGTYGVTLDFTVNVLPVPTCLAPTALTVNPSQITTTSATVSWTAPTTTAANGYEYYYTTSTDVPTSTTTPSGTFAAGSTSGDVTGLNNSTVYRLYIRSVCSDNDRSAWSAAVTFTTLCDISPLPYTIDFESVTVPALPTCTSTENLGAGNNWVTVSNPGNGFTTKALRYGWNGTNPANTWFFTNRVTLVAGLQYIITYKYGNNSTTFVEKLKVAYGNSANSTAMTTELADHPSINTGALQSNTVTFSPTVSGEYVFGFHAYSIANQFNLHLDDIVIQEALSSGNFDNNSFTAYPNPVKDKLNVRFVENITSATIYNILGQEVIVNNINKTEDQIDMSHLPTGTYLVKVVSGSKTQTIKVIKE